MIISARGKVQIAGTTPEILSDVASVLTATREMLTKEYDEKAAEELINQTIQVSAMTDEEIEAESQVLKEKLNKSKEEASSFMSELMKMLMRGMGE